MYEIEHSSFHICYWNPFIILMSRLKKYYLLPVFKTEMQFYMALMLQLPQLLDPKTCCMLMTNFMTIYRSSQRRTKVNYYRIMRNRLARPTYIMGYSWESWKFNKINFTCKPSISISSWFVWCSRRHCRFTARNWIGFFSQECGHIQHDIITLHHLPRRQVRLT